MKAFAVKKLYMTKKVEASERLENIVGKGENVRHQPWPHNIPSKFSKGFPLWVTKFVNM